MGVGGICLKLDVQSQEGGWTRGVGGGLKIEQFSWTTYVYHSLCAPEINKMFVYKHTETTECVKK